eukprot:2394_1
MSYSGVNEMTLNSHSKHSAVINSEDDILKLMKDRNIKNASPQLAQSTTPDACEYLIVVTDDENETESPIKHIDYLNILDEPNIKQQKNNKKLSTKKHSTKRGKIKKGPSKQTASNKRSKKGSAPKTKKRNKTMRKLSKSKSSPDPEPIHYIKQQQNEQKLIKMKS